MTMVWSPQARDDLLTIYRKWSQGNVACQRCFFAEQPAEAEIYDDGNLGLILLLICPVKSTFKIIAVATRQYAIMLKPSNDDSWSDADIGGKASYGLLCEPARLNEGPKLNLRDEQVRGKTVCFLFLGSIASDLAPVKEYILFPM